MKIDNYCSVKNKTQEITLFELIKSRLDEIQTEEEFEDFVRLSTMSMQGCIDYVNAVNFTERSVLLAC